ncbi:MAG: terminase endonuclease subunit [Pseudomonas sp.]|uniref:phage terminase small subunit n=1 Tax=Pseudomonas sp. TaxID=306 RepID=UPI00339362F9
MTSPAQRHFARVTASLAAALAVDHGSMTMEGATAYELMLAKQADDRRRLKTLQSIARKIELKRELLPDYDAYVEGVLAGGRGAQDDVLVTVMTWRIDTGDYPGALLIASYVLQHKLTLPDRFERTMGTYIAEEIAEQALRALTAKEPFDIDVLGQTGTLTAAEDMPDEVRAKLHKAIGLLLIGDIDLKVELAATNQLRLEMALPHLQQALQLHERCGVKRDIENVERSLKKHVAPATP